MRKNLTGSIQLIIMAIIMAFAITPSILAQSAGKPGAAKSIPDLSGVWDNSPAHTSFDDGITGPGYAFQAMGRGGIPRQGFLMKGDPEPSMQPEAVKKFKANNAGLIINDSSITDPNVLDPRMSCFPPGPTQFYTIPFPVEIQQRPDQVLMLFEYDHWVRRIYLNEKTHPDGYPVTWMGHSIGWYEGDTLVVDTVGINDKTWLDSQGHPHSDALHLVERFRRVNHDTLDIQLQFDDPKTYTKPWTGKKILQLMPKDFQVMEHIACEDFLELGKHR